MKNIISALIVLFLCQYTIAQSVSVPTVSSTGAAKAVEANVNYNNGTANIPIPIHTIDDWGNSFPISLSYQTGGVRVTDIASSVGLGWSLNAGGAVHREVRGVPDSYNYDSEQKGFLHKICDTDDEGIENEPDLYYVSLLGNTAKFFIDKSGEVVLLNNSSVLIEYDLSCSSLFFSIVSFTVTLPNGIVGYFSIPERTYGIEKWDANFSGHKFNSAWHIEKIDYLNGKSIEFNYNHNHYYVRSIGDVNRYVYGTGNLINSDENNHKIDDRSKKTLIFSPTIESITSDFTKVVFSGDERKDVLGLPSWYSSTPLKNINLIQIFKRKKIEEEFECYSKFTLDNNDYFDCELDGIHSDNLESFSDLKYKMKLNSISRVSCHSGTYYTISFLYHEELKLPSVLSHSRDYWGYHNGVYENKSLTPKVIFNSECFDIIDMQDYQYTKSMPSPYDFAVSREPNFDFAKLGSLKKINYPDDYFMEFEYELNTVYHKKHSQVLIQEGEIIIGEDVCFPGPNTLSFFEFNEIELGDDESKLLVFMESSGPCFNDSYELEIYVKESNEPSYSFNEDDIIKFHGGERSKTTILYKSDLKLLGLNVGQKYDIKLQVKNPESLRAKVSTSFFDVSAVYGDNDVGGLRVESISTPENTRSFNYQDLSTNFIPDAGNDIRIDLKICKSCPSSSNLSGDPVMAAATGVNTCGQNDVDNSSSVFIPCETEKVELTIQASSSCSNLPLVEVSWYSSAGDGGFTYLASSNATQTYDLLALGIMPGNSYSFSIMNGSFPNSESAVTSRAWIDIVVPEGESIPVQMASSGRLNDLPTFLSKYINIENEGKWLFNACWNDEIYVIHSNPITSLNSLNGGSITYGKVTETIDELKYGRTEYKFNIDQNALNEHSITNDLDPLNPLFGSLPRVSSIYLDPIYGSLTSVSTFDANDNMVSQKANNYFTEKKNYHFSSIARIMKCEDDDDDPDPSVIGSYYTAVRNYSYQASTLLLSKNESMIDGVSKVTEYEYSPSLEHYNPIIISTYSKHQPTKKYDTYMYYAHDEGNQELIDKNFVNTPLRIEQGYNCIRGGKKVDYEIVGNVIRPKSTYEGYNDNGTVHWKKISEVLDYNSDQQPQEVWSKFAPHNTHYTYENGLLNSKRYYNRKSTYTYDNLRRLTSTTDPSGIKNEYLEYDGRNRLRKESLSNHHKVNEYFYFQPLFAGHYKDYVVTSYPNSEYDLPDKISSSIYNYKRQVHSKSLENYTQSGSNFSTSYLYNSLGIATAVCDPSVIGCDVMTKSDDILQRTLTTKAAGSDKLVTYQYGTNHQGEIAGYNPNTLHKKSITDEDGNTSHSFTDVFGKPIATIDAMGYKTLNIYDPNTQLLTEVVPPESAVGNLGLNYKYTYYPDRKKMSDKIPGQDNAHVYNYHQDYEYVESEVLHNGTLLEYIPDPNYISFIREVHKDGELIKEFTPFYDDMRNSWLGSSKVKVLGLNKWLEYKVDEYDLDLGLVLESSDQYLDGASVEMENKYDDSGTLRQNKSIYIGIDGQSRSTIKDYEYDNGIWLAKSKLTTDFRGEEKEFELSSNKYDDFGRLIATKVGNLHDTEYGYHPRGWISRINSVEQTNHLDDEACEKEEEDPSCEQLLSYFGVDISIDEDAISTGSPTGISLSVSEGYNPESPFYTETYFFPFNEGSLESVGDIPSYSFSIYDASTLEPLQTWISDLVLGSMQSTNGDNAPQNIESLEDLVSILSMLGGEEVGPDEGEGPSDSPSDPLPPSSIFGMEIHYDEANPNVEAIARHNGNISWIEWKVQEEAYQAYGFTYDNINRLTQAKYISNDPLNCIDIPTGAYDVNIGYEDGRGNINNIRRKGLSVTSAEGEMLFGTIDNIKMNYTDNQLTSVIENGITDKGYQSGNGSLTYSNGNLVSKPGVSEVRYNYLDLPILIQSAEGTISITYDANGSKLSQYSIPSSGAAEKINYVGELEYIDGKLTSLYHEQGRLLFDAEMKTSNGLVTNDFAEYTITDHLGNVRVRYVDKNADGKLTTTKDEAETEIIGSFHYYPFGMLMEGNFSEQQSVTNRYQYNGIEHSDILSNDIGLTTYRVHDAALGRWWQVDPKAEGAYSQTPYNSMFNNPISMSDPNGDFALFGIGAATFFAASTISGMINGNLGKNGNNPFGALLSGAQFGNAVSAGVGGIIAYALSSSLPSYQVQVGDWNFGISPAIAFGSNGFSIGAAGSIGYSDGNFSAGISGGIGFGSHSLGANSVSGFHGNVGGGFGYSESGGGYNFSLYSNQTFGRGIGQRVGGARVGFKDTWHVGYENDGTPFNHVPGMNDKGDRWRTNAFSIGVKGADLRLNMFTGDPTGEPDMTNPDYPLGVHTGDANMYRLGALSLGYKGYRAGWNSEGIRNTFQNKFAHGIVSPQPWFRRMSSRSSPYNETSTFSNPYSLWSF